MKKTEGIAQQYGIGTEARTSYKINLSSHIGLIAEVTLKNPDFKNLSRSE